jgi:hypothetical protein
MTLQFATIIVSVLDFVAWIFIASATFLSGSDQTTKGLDNVAFVLALKARAPKTALALALAFPATFAVLFIALVVAFK